MISADRSPSDLRGLEERIRSRLGWGLVADIHPTTYELRLGILQAKAEQLRRRDPAEGARVPGHPITCNVRELEGALNRIVAPRQPGRPTPITLDMAQEVLKDLLRANDRRVTIEEIQKAVAEHYNIRWPTCISARRARAVARPRQVAMYLAKQLTAALPAGDRQASSAAATTPRSCTRSGRSRSLRASDQSFAEDVELLRRMLEG